jgi:hypothetical protein
MGKGEGYDRRREESSVHPLVCTWRHLCMLYSKWKLKADPVSIRIMTASLRLITCMQLFVVTNKIVRTFSRLIAMGLNNV